MDVNPFLRSNKRFRRSGVTGAIPSGGGSLGLACSSSESDPPSEDDEFVTTSTLNFEVFKIFKLVEYLLQLKSEDYKNLSDTFVI